MKTELLSPAGNLMAGYAALYYGADAVYLGLKNFSARSKAENFDKDQLNEFTAFAHTKGKKVYVALNTLIQEKELPLLLEALDACKQCQIDALIVQDIGVARIVKKYYPELVLHASTQMAIHNEEGALFLKQIGFKRVVLARELSLNKIKKIAAIPDLEIEVFIHGALCYCYSGLCLFSSILYGESANRGKCLYPCRALFKTKEKESHLFSMKDFALLENVLKLPNCSLKIEGRKKSPLYVAAVTDYYRTLLDKRKVNKEKENNIKQIFSRLWTDLNFNGKNHHVIDEDFVGHRGLYIGNVGKVIHKTLYFKTNYPVMRYDGLQIDIPGIEKPLGFSIQELKINHKNVFESKKGDIIEVSLPSHCPYIPQNSPIYLASSMRVKGSYPFTHPKPNEFKIRPKIKVSATITPESVRLEALGFSVEEKGIFLPVNNPDKLKSNIEKTLQKYKDTNFEACPIHIHNEHNLFVPLSLLNDLRRKLYTAIQLPKTTPILPHLTKQPQQHPQWILKTDFPTYLSHIEKKLFSEFIILIDRHFTLKQISFLPKEKIRIALPTTEQNPHTFLSIIEKLIKNGYRKWEIGNFWGMSLLQKYSNLDISYAPSLYMLNSQAILHAQELNASRISLSVEDTKDNLYQLASTSPLPTTLIVYQNIPLFTSQHCLHKNCATCAKKTFFTKIQKNNQKFIAQTKECETKVFSESPFYLKDYSTIPSTFYQIDLTYLNYEEKQIQHLIQDIQSNQPLLFSLSANLEKNL